MLIKKINKNDKTFKISSILGQFFVNNLNKKDDKKSSVIKKFSNSKINRKSLVLEGLGYEVFFSHKKKYLNFKLSLSHLYTIKIPSGIFVIIPNNKNIICYSLNNDLLSSWISCIKTIKKPNSFKKKGIFYENEKIVLKKGKSSK